MQFKLRLIWKNIKNYFFKIKHGLKYSIITYEFILKNSSYTQ
jgi:hypothetical protein